jgi:hypothetical protein
VSHPAVTKVWRLLQVLGLNASVQAADDSRGIANRHTPRWHVVGDHTSGTYYGILANVNTGQDDATRPYPGVVFNDHGRGWWHHEMVLEIVLVVIDDECVMTEKAVSPNTHKLVRRNGRAVIDEGVIAYQDTPPSAGNELNWYDIADQSYALAENHFAAGNNVDLAP